MQFLTNLEPSGDVNGIEVGSNTNIQDNVVVHVAKHSIDGTPQPTIIGSNVTIGTRRMDCMGAWRCRANPRPCMMLCFIACAGNNLLQLLAMQVTARPSMLRPSETTASLEWERQCSMVPRWGAHPTP